MKDLTSILESCKNTIGFDSVDDLPKRLLDICESNNHEIMNKFCNEVEDLSIDWLQKIFQYYLADRKEKMQDYSPASLGDLLSELVTGNSILDMCAGSGALTIRCWNHNNERRFVCLEYDERACSVLLFNLAVRNIESVVVRCDVLSQEVFNTWTVSKGETFGNVEKGGEPFKCDCCISNPPYNMKWKHPDFAPMQSRFAGYSLPPESNANYAFVLSAMDKADRGIFILPNGVLSSSGKEGKVREDIIKSNILDSVISCPDGMFESTSIPVCVCVFDKNKETATIEMIDSSENCIKEERDQRGQFGGKSHTNRVYKKIVSVFSDENIKRMVSAIKNRSSEEDFSKAVTIKEIENNGLIAIPKRYIDQKQEETIHRPYDEIVNDINMIIKEKSGLKLTVNETLAKSIGLYEVFESQNQSNEISESLGSMLKCVIDKPIEKAEYIRVSKNKNELKFENGSKEQVSEILLMILQQWKTKLYYLNNQENIYLAELRDALLPDLMSGKINLEKL